MTAFGGRTLDKHYQWKNKLSQIILNMVPLSFSFLVNITTVIYVILRDRPGCNVTA